MQKNKQKRNIKYVAYPIQYNENKIKKNRKRPLNSCFLQAISFKVFLKNVNMNAISSF